MVWFLSVVIDTINILHAIIETEDHSPVSPDSHCPKAFHLAFEPMQPQLRLVDVSKSGSSMQCRQNVPQLVGMFRIYAPWVVHLKKPF